MKNWTERTGSGEPVKLTTLRNEFIGSVLEDFFSEAEMKEKIFDMSNIPPAEVDLVNYIANRSGFATQDQLRYSLLFGKNNVIDDGLYPLGYSGNIYISGLATSIADTHEAIGKERPKMDEDFLGKVSKSVGDNIKSLVKASKGIE